MTWANLLRGWGGRRPISWHAYLLQDRILKVIWYELCCCMFSKFAWQWDSEHFLTFNFNKQWPVRHCWISWQFKTWIIYVVCFHIPYSFHCSSLWQSCKFLNEQKLCQSLLEFPVPSKEVVKYLKTRKMLALIWISLSKQNYRFVILMYYTNLSMYL